MPTYPSINDRDYDLWKKIAWNFYEFAVSQGVTGLNPPTINDTESTDLQKKITYYTASLT